tara:strand:+ start:327 stop:725 length:399 start_codon:yes stop_codon:yes gene_type:complete
MSYGIQVDGSNLTYSAFSVHSKGTVSPITSGTPFTLATAIVVYKYIQPGGVPYTGLGYYWPLGEGSLQQGSPFTYHPEFSEFRVIFTPTQVRDTSNEELRPYANTDDGLNRIIIYRGNSSQMVTHQYMVLAR